MVTYDTYRNVYGGTADEARFSSVAGTAEAALRALIYPNEVSAVPSDVFSRAVCIQVEHMLCYGAESARRVKSEAIGDRSVTYENVSGITICGVSVAAEAALLLRESGGISCWV